MLLPPGHQDQQLLGPITHTVLLAWTNEVLMLTGQTLTVHIPNLHHRTGTEKGREPWPAVPSRSLV